MRSSLIHLKTKNERIMNMAEFDMYLELESVQMYLKGIKTLADRLADSPINGDPTLTMDLIAQLIDKRIERIDEVLGAFAKK